VADFRVAGEEGGDISDYQRWCWSSGISSILPCEYRGGLDGGSRRSPLAIPIGASPHLRRALIPAGLQ
jgi:hypothetical protein